MRRYPTQLAQWQANTAYLEQALSEVAGITTLRQDARVTSNAYHVLFLQYHADAFGRASKERFLAALRAEWIDGVHVGYSLTDYSQAAWPVTDQACDEEALWVRQNLLLGTRQDMDDIVAAMAKIQNYSAELQE